MNRDPIETQTMVPIGTRLGTLLATVLLSSPFSIFIQILEKYIQQTIHSHPKSKLAMRAFSLKKRIWSSFSAERLDRWSVATRPPYEKSLSTLSWAVESGAASPPSIRPSSSCHWGRQPSHNLAKTCTIQNYLHPLHLKCKP